MLWFTIALYGVSGLSILTAIAVGIVSYRFYASA